MLDLVAVREGGTVADALAIALRTAQHVERLGFARYWLAEHHNMSGIASSATAVLVGHIAAGTRTIRVGSAYGAVKNEMVAEEDGVVARWFERHRCAAAIVRPDHYVFGVSSDTATLCDMMTELSSRLQ